MHRSDWRRWFPGSGARGWALAMGVLALWLYWGTVLQFDLAGSPAYNLSPWPDGHEYYAGAVSLKDEGAYFIHVAGRAVPPRYPFGFSFLQVPFLSSSGPPLAPFEVNQICGLFILLTLFFGMWWLGFRYGAGFSVVLMATLPGFIISCRSPLSEPSSSVFLLLGLFALALSVKKSQLWSAALGSFLLGLSFNVRAANLCFLAVAGLAPLWFHRKSVAKRLSVSAASGASFLIGALPTLLYNYQNFGSPLSTGYSLWVTRLADFRQVFRLEHVGRNLKVIWQEIVQSEARFSVADIYGLGSYVGPAFILLILISVWFALGTRRLFPFWCSAGIALSLMLLYFFDTNRLLFPILVFLVPCVAFSLERGLKRALRGGRGAKVLGGVLLLLFAAHSLGYPGPEGSAETLRYWDSRSGRGFPQAFRTVQKLEQARSGGPTLILTDLDPPYVYALTRGERMVAPLTDRHRYRHNPNYFVFGEKEIERAVTRAVEREQEVFAALALNPLEELADLRPPPACYEWIALAENLPRIGGVARLERDESKCPRLVSTAPGAFSDRSQEKVGTRLLFPIFGGGSTEDDSLWLAGELVLTNRSNESAAVVLHFRGDHGEPRSLRLNGEEASGMAALALASRSRIRLRMEEDAPFAVVSLTVESDRAVSAEVSFRGPWGEVKMPPSESARHFRARLGRQNETRLAVALMNPGEKTAVRVWAEGRGIGGELRKTGPMRLEPMARRSFFLDEMEWNEAAGTSFSPEVVEFKGDGEFAVTLLSGADLIHPEEISQSR